MHPHVPDRSSEDHGTSEPVSDLLRSDDGEVPVPPGVPWWLVDARAGAQGEDVRQVHQYDGDHQALQQRGPRVLDLPGAGGDAIEPADVPVDDIDELDPVRPRGLVPFAAARVGGLEEGAGVAGVQEHCVRAQHHEREDDDQEGERQAPPDRVEEDEVREAERDAEERLAQPCGPELESIREAQRLDQPESDDRVEGVVEQAGEPAPVALLEAPELPEGLRDPDRVPPVVGEHRRQLGGDEHHRHGREQHPEGDPGQAEQRPRARDDRLGAPGPSADVEVGDEGDREPVERALVGRRVADERPSATADRQRARLWGVEESGALVRRLLVREPLAPARPHRQPRPLPVVVAEHPFCCGRGLLAFDFVAPSMRISWPSPFRMRSSGSLLASASSPPHVEENNANNRMLPPPTTKGIRCAWGEDSGKG
mmetsp:Transcript_13188/g.32363  ORF Transcript_13188/g.32363 Transcript_13188/m.32363 type:complete len:425 (+) Transcript_13188:1098-2372(+)